MRSKIISLMALLFATAELHGQTYPLVIVNSDQGSQTLGTLGIYTGPDGPNGNQLTRFNVSSKLVASSLTTGTAFPGSGTNPATTSYFHVDIPGTGSARTGYVPAGSTLTNPDCGSNYIHVNNSSIAVTTAAGGTSNITIGGSGAKVFSGQNFAVKSSRQIGSVNYYEIYLTNDCSASSGWVSGAGGSVSVGSNDGISTPALSASGYNGTSVSMGWQLAEQPRGLVATMFDIYRSTNGGQAVKLATQTENAYTDIILVASNAYTYTITARYGNCSSETSNPQNRWPFDHGVQFECLNLGQQQC